MSYLVKPNKFINSVNNCIFLYYFSNDLVDLYAFSFQCVWCPALKRCSSGVDRHRQAWLMKGCDQVKMRNATLCSGTSPYDRDESNSAYVHEGMNIYGNSTGASSSFSKHKDVLTAPQPDRLGFSGVLAIMILLMMLVATSMWVFYAYKNPHTTSGQMLIRVRLNTLFCDYVHLCLHCCFFIIKTL